MLQKIELPYTKKKTTDSMTSGLRSHPFAMYFVYAKDAQSVITGPSEDVEAYIEKHFPRCIYRYTFWKDGRQRGGWGSTLCVYIRHHACGEPFKRTQGRQDTYISVVTRDGWIPDALVLRRMTHKWLPIYDRALTKAENRGLSSWQILQNKTVEKA